MNFVAKAFIKSIRGVKVAWGAARKWLGHYRDTR
jgi:hypothetical protein